uniref:Sushi domain-containing protein n=1 Tax=Laticauda laticaudata TaxID=8630 RepID=A0A8C5WYA8_LATLA
CFKMETKLKIESGKFHCCLFFPLESCDYPPRLVSAELMDEYKEKDFFPVGSTVKYKCRPGYMKKAGTYSSTCNRNQQWSKVQELCKRKTCGHPGEPDGGRLLVTGDFDLGSTAHYQCDGGYRLIGKSTRKCKVLNNKMEWTDEVPYCEIIPCSPPPKIPHGKYDGEYLHSFYYGTVVKYTCDKDYPLIGNASIYCTSKDGINGEWSGHAYCGETQCPSPQIKNGKIVAGISSTYKYNQKVSFECIGGHEMVGSREIHCQVDGTWDPPIPVCEQKTEDHPSHGFPLLSESDVSKEIPTKDCFKTYLLVSELGKFNCRVQNFVTIDLMVH